MVGKAEKRRISGRRKADTYVRENEEADVAPLEAHLDPSMPCDKLSSRLAKYMEI